jgi:hypothetical protein
MLSSSKTHKHQNYLAQFTKVREEKTFGSIGVFPPTEPMNLISALSL